MHNFSSYNNSHHKGKFLCFFYLKEKPRTFFLKMFSDFSNWMNLLIVFIDTWVFPLLRNGNFPLQLKFPFKLSIFPDVHFFLSYFFKDLKLPENVVAISSLQQPLSPVLFSRWWKWKWKTTTVDRKKNC